MSKGLARSVTDASPAPSASTTRRRVGSARARNTLSMGAVA